MGPVSGLLRIYLFVLFAYVILSFVPRPPEPLMPAVRVVRGLVDPILGPIRQRLSPVRIGGIALDLSIILLFIGVQVLAWIAAGFGL